MRQGLVKKVGLILLVILLLILIAVGVYGFAWWKLKQSADQFARQLAPFAELNYTDVFLDLPNSQIGIKEMRLQPVGMNGVILLDRATIIFSSWSELFELQQKLAQGQLPDALRIELKKLQLDLHSGYMQDFGLILEQSQRQAGVVSHGALACGDLSYFTLADMRRMGVQRILSDIAFSYAFKPAQKQIDVQFKINSPGLSKIDLASTLQLSIDALSAQTAVFAQPRLKSIELAVADRGYNVRRSKYCAGLNDESVDEYQLNHSKALQQAFTGAGWLVTEETVQAYSAFYRPGGQLLVRISHPEGLGVQHMATIQTPLQLLKTLNPHIAINQQALSLETVGWQLPDPDSTPPSLKSDIVAQEQLETPPDAEVDPYTQTYITAPRAQYGLKKDQTKSFKEVDLAELEQSIGKQVRLFTDFGQSVEGELLEVTAKEVIVERRLIDGRGTATYPIAKDKIQIAELFK